MKFREGTAFPEGEAERTARARGLMRWEKLATDHGLIDLKLLFTSLDEARIRDPSALAKKQDDSHVEVDPLTFFVIHAPAE